MQLQERRLARAVVSDQADGGAVGHLERHVLEGPEESSYSARPGDEHMRCFRVWFAHGRDGTSSRPCRPEAACRHSSSAKSPRPNSPRGELNTRGEIASTTRQQRRTPAAGRTGSPPAARHVVVTSNGARSLDRVSRFRFKAPITSSSELLLHQRRGYTIGVSQNHTSRARSSRCLRGRGRSPPSPEGRPDTSDVAAHEREHQRDQDDDVASPRRRPRRAARPTGGGTNAEPDDVNAGGSRAGRPS